MTHLFDTTFDLLIAGREREFPTLARAAAHTRPTRSVKPEWITDSGEHEFNYCQIVRVLCTPRERESEQEARARGLTEFLTTVERILAYGHRYFDTSGSCPRSFCGGAESMLGRPVEDGDELSLLVLRHPFLRMVEDRYGREEAEWLGEFSLQVRPAAFQMVDA